MERDGDEMKSGICKNTQSNKSNKSKNSFGATPFMLGCLDGHVSVVRLLKDPRVDVAEKDDYSCETPLSNAVSNGHLEVVELLLQVAGNSEILLAVKLTRPGTRCVLRSERRGEKPCLSCAD